MSRLQQQQKKIIIGRILLSFFLQSSPLLPLLRLSHRLIRLGILSGELVKGASILVRVLDVARIALGARIIGLEMEILRLDLGRDRVARRGHHVARGADVAGASRHVERVVGRRGERGLRDAVVTESGVFLLLIWTGFRGDGILQPCIVGHARARRGHVLQGTATMRVVVGHDDVFYREKNKIFHRV